LLAKADDLSITTWSSDNDAKKEKELWEGKSPLDEAGPFS